MALLVFVVALARMIDVAGTGEASRDSNVVLGWVTGGAVSSQERLPDWLAPTSRAVAVVLVVASMLSVLIDVVVASPAVALVVPWVVAVSVWMWRSEPRPAVHTPMP